jgi:hypothetical protein
MVRRGVPAGCDLANNKVLKGIKADRKENKDDVD